ncbi:MAG: 23S rRNA (guanosine(2251)-2'-O)-methyltransferase RlmB, partial [Actinomycetota bacterium]|nr:23S rRNA (guanosine(2251)-2'-O)-methyltransferase RlmB [Actinomycetota bacterium]
EGRQAVRELLLAARREVREVVVAHGRVRSPALEEIESLARAAGVPIREVSPGQLAARATSDVPQGVLAVADPLLPVDLAELVTGGSPSRVRPPLLVVFDGVTDPHNLGAVMRSALCAGATGAVLGRHRSAHVTATVAKAAAGAVEHLPIALVSGVGAALEQLARAGVWTVGLDERGDRVVDDLELATEPLALVLGAEGRGLSTLTRKRCDVLARIPLDGPLSSLNVSAAAAVALFAVARRRAAAR